MQTLNYTQCYRFTTTAVMQQQSEETCISLDRMIAGRQQLSNCTRNPSCTMISCVSGSINVSITIFPCTTPASVGVISNAGMGVNLLVTESKTVRFTPEDTAKVFLTQIYGGIRFGVSVSVIPVCIRHAFEHALVQITIRASP